MKQCVDASGYAGRATITDADAFVSATEQPCLDRCGGRESSSAPSDGYAYRYYVQGECSRGRSN